jgi:hypothetical protein
MSRTAEAQAPGTIEARPTKTEGRRIPRDSDRVFTTADFVSPYRLRVFLMLDLASRVLILGWAILRLLAALVCAEASGRFGGASRQCRDPVGCHKSVTNTMYCHLKVHVCFN